MLNKVKVAMAVGVVIKVVTFFVPDLPMPEGTQDTLADAVMLGLMWFSFWKTKESKGALKKLVTKD